MTYLGEYFKKYAGRSKPTLNRMNSSPVLLSSEQKARFMGMSLYSLYGFVSFLMTL